jgi:hypothetical protein
MREDTVAPNASVGRPQTLLFVATDLRVPPCDDARGADAGKQILAGLRRRACVGWLGAQVVGDL